MNTPFASPAEMPRLRSTHRGRWRPIFLEPIIDSGERLCIGVVAADDKSCVVESVAGLDRLSSVYGEGATSFTWAARLALKEIQHRVTVNGFDSLADGPAIDGLSMGDPRPGAGTGLSDLARVAMHQVASLANESPLMQVPTIDRFPMELEVVAETGRGPHVERKVKNDLIRRHPDRRVQDHFGKLYRPSQSARALRFGFVGDRLVANFATLVATNPNPPVDRAKARLWDLQQLRSGVLADQFRTRSANGHEYELLTLSPNGRAARTTGVGNARPEMIEAEEELEAEADKFDIRFLPMLSVQLIAAHLSSQEFGGKALR